MIKKIKELSRFIWLTIINFIIIFWLLNFSAIKEIISPYIFVKETKEKTDIIEKSIWEKVKKQELMIPIWAKKTLKKEYPIFELEISPIDTRLIIPKLWTNVPIIDMSIDSLQVNEWGEFEDNVQDLLRNWVVHYPWTANAWEIWNMFITWHSSYYPWDKWRYKDVFARLNKLNIWDEYYIFQHQKKYKYKIIEKKEVSPKDVSVLKQEDNKTVSTLMTCTPVGTTLRRLIIVAELKS